MPLSHMTHSIIMVEFLKSLIRIRAQFSNSSQGPKWKIVETYCHGKLFYLSSQVSQFPVLAKNRMSDFILVFTRDRSCDFDLGQKVIGYTVLFTFLMLYLADFFTRWGLRSPKMN